ncbi:unnamed protein product [Prunus armeniaca]|uniref:Uncharacterized protein n=1 Tax=Prunus armeniaca TaxID=36596 RepID=A0A6J5TGI0_PRUAR|nr:unnamed protein product [Prunus armeniaca]
MDQGIPALNDFSKALHALERLAADPSLSSKEIIFPFKCCPFSEKFLDPPLYEMAADLPCNGELGWKGEDKSSNRK